MNPAAMPFFFFSWSLLGLLWFLGPCPLPAENRPGFPAAGPLSPREEQATFRLPRGFKIELAACEPEVIDPVAMAFDEEGRLFVVEMRGYPNEGVGTGTISSGRIKLLEDRDGDGFFEKATTFADQLRLPTSVMPCQGGVLVGNPPEILFLQDSDGDGRADVRRTLYTGFGLANIQQMVNSLQWGLDNWVHGCVGSDGGTIRSGAQPAVGEVVLRGRGIRFKPEVPGSLEPTSGGGQFGLAVDDWGRWFTATNSQHLRHIVLPDQYLRRNPFLAVSAVTLDIPDHGAVCKVHRISPFEAWRVERTTRRKQGPDAKRFSPTELVPGGFITSACSPLVYRAGLFPAEFYGNTFVCDPANNLVHRDILEPRGATFSARRGDQDCEFLASTHTWFRPVNLELGPDGAIYLADFYREVIETPLSLPDDIKKRFNLQSRDRGRIWRIVPESARPQPAKARPSLRKAAAQLLVSSLADNNAWWRLTAQRLLLERKDKKVAPAIRELLQNTNNAQGKVHALWTLDGLDCLQVSEIEKALGDPVPGVRENALRLAESRLASSVKLRAAVAALADDPDSRVRFQLAFTLGEGDDPVLAAALARLLRRHGSDYWMQTALLSSAGKSASALVENLIADQDFIQTGTGRLVLVKVLSLVGARGDEADLARILALLGRDKGKSLSWQSALLEGLGQGLQNSQRSLSRLWEKPTPALAQALERAKPFFARAARVAGDDRQSLAERLSAVRLLALGPSAPAAEHLQTLFSPQTPQQLQLAGVRALASLDHPTVAEILLGSWNSFSPVLRREVLEALFASSDRLEKLLLALEQKKIVAGQLEPARLEQLRKHPRPEVRQRAKKVLAGQVAPDRQKIVQVYQPVLELKADDRRGQAIFKKTCATCHRLENVGNEVGADLLAALRNKTPQTLLVDILDPSREVDPRYIDYLLSTRSGKVLSGLIASETASSVTLRRAEKAEDTVLRSQIESIQATTKSLMPDGLEMQLSRQDLADLIAYLLAVPIRSK